jgi:hypothetical protein
MNSFIRSYTERNMEILFCFNFSNLTSVKSILFCRTFFATEAQKHREKFSASVCL